MRAIWLIFVAVVAVTCEPLPVAAQGLERLVGGWNNQSMGTNIAILRATIGGWDIWIGDKGQARISTTAAYGANIWISGSEFNCYYFVAITNNFQNMNWQLKGGIPLNACLEYSAAHPSRTEMKKFHDHRRIR
jgi:hypothetical protein